MTASTKMALETSERYVHTTCRYPDVAYRWMVRIRWTPEDTTLVSDLTLQESLSLLIQDHVSRSGRKLTDKHGCEQRAFFHIFLVTLILKINFFIVEINDFWGELSDILAKSATLVASTEMRASTKASIKKQSYYNVNSIDAEHNPAIISTTSISKQSLERIPDLFILASSARDVAHASASF